MECRPTKVRKMDSAEADCSQKEGNDGQRQKKSDDDDDRAVIACDVGAELGWIHVAHASPPWKAKVESITADYVV